MRSIFSLTLPLTMLLIQPVIAQTPLRPASHIEQVTVFLQGAQVTRQASAQLSAGNNRIIISGISPDVDEKSIQVKGTGNYTLLAVTHQPNYLKEQTKREETEQLAKEQAALREKMEKENNQLQVYTQQEALLTKNQSIGGTNGIKATDLQAMLDFQRARLSEILDKQQAIRQNIKTLEADLRRIELQLNALRQQNEIPTSDIMLEVLAKSAGSGTFTVSYLVKNAGWRPDYDIRVKDITQPLNITFKAAVFQQCGEEWKNVKLQLSTGNPQENNIRPVLEPWYVRRFTPMSAPAQLNEVVVSAYNADARREMAGIRGKAVVQAAMVVPNVITQYQATTFYYDIPLPYTIASDGKPYHVNVKETNIPATYEYYAVPKLDKSAYLVAGITEWESLNLLDGDANVFYGDTYLGKTRLDLKASGDTLLVSLGRDKQVTVTRTLEKDYSKKQFIGRNITVSRSWMLGVKNNKSVPVSITLQDQLPISSSSDLEISSTSYGNAQLDESTNILNWKMTVAPAKEAKQQLKYAITYPKTAMVNID